MPTDPTYFELTYAGPWKGIDVSMPENMIDSASTPDSSNWILRAGELRTRPFKGPFLAALPDGSAVTGHTSFIDSNGVWHTVVTSTSGLWQLNSQWRKYPGQTWSLVGRYINSNYPAPTTPVQFIEFLNSVCYVNGSSNLWLWNGLEPNSMTANVALQNIAIYDTTNILSAGAYFVGELNSQIILINTIEQVQAVAGPTLPKENANFPQRIRWSASGLPTTWDPTVNVSAGYNDLLDCPDTLTGFLTIGLNGFIFRVNGITEMTAISGGVLPWQFDHLWASDRGIGNVYPWSIASYGPVGIFIATDDIYEISLGGFQKIGAGARNAIFIDINNAVAAPTASIFPGFSAAYPYLTYMLTVPLPNNTNQHWVYFVEDKAWMKWPFVEGYQINKVRMVPTQ